MTTLMKVLAVVNGIFLLPMTTTLSIVCVSMGNHFWAVWMGVCAIINAYVVCAYWDLEPTKK